MNNPVKIPGWPEAFTPQMPGFGGKSDDAAPANPFMGSLDFMKNLWGSLPSGAPGFVVPTFDLADLDKRIKDLKAVQSWLNVNANMLNATIQGLEVQRNTIAAIQAIGGTMGNNAAEFFKSASTTPAASAETAKTQAEPDWGSIAPGWPNTAANGGTRTESGKKDAAAEPSAVPVGARRKSSSAESADASTSLQATPATAWLGFMQEQFAKIASAAVAPVVAPVMAPVVAPGAAATSDAGVNGSARASRPTGSRAARKTGGSSMVTSTAPPAVAANADIRSESAAVGRKAVPKIKKSGK